MAYNRGYNPDALPAHAEPEQAAQMMNSSGKPSNAALPIRQSSTAGGSANYNKPVPPPPNQQGYGRTPPPPSGGYGQQPPPPQNQGYSNNQSYGHHPPSGYNDYNRVSSPRYESNTSPRYNQQAPPPQTTQQQYGGYSQQQQAPPPRNTYASPPPPSNYGNTAPPQYHNRPPIPTEQRPPTVAPPRDANDRDALWPLFLQVDKDRSGQLSETELSRALVNGDYTAFDMHTVRMMVRMFDTDRSGTINFDEFCGLWGFLAAWRNLFDRFDLDKSGNISYQEFSDALVAFGYRLSNGFVGLLFGTYAKKHSRGRGDDGEREKVLSFDLFVQACISLKRMTDVFKRFDTDRDGYITLSFEEFLTGAQGLFLFNSISPQTDTGLY